MAWRRAPIIVVTGHKSSRRAKCLGFRKGFLTMGTLGGLMRPAGFSGTISHATAHRKNVEIPWSRVRTVRGAKSRCFRDSR